MADKSDGCDHREEMSKRRRPVVWVRVMAGVLALAATTLTVALAVRDLFQLADLAIFL